MKVYLIIILKLLATAFLVYYLTAGDDQLLSHDSTTICLQSQSVHKLCAQCFRRDSQFLSNKGYHVVSSSPTSVLKIGTEKEALSCSQLLQIIDVEKDHVEGVDFHLEPIEPVLKILSQMGAKFYSRRQEMSQSEYIVEPWYQQFVIFKWKEYSKESQTSVTSVNPQFYNSVKTNLLYIFNFMLLVIGVAYLADQSFIKDLSKPIKISLAVILVCFQLWLLGVAKWWCHYLLRLLVLNLGLFKLRVNNLKVLSYLGVGLLMTYFPFTICVYTGAITIMVAYYGRDQEETRSIKLFLVIFYTLLLLNYSYWYQFVVYLNDVPSIIIEFCTLMFIPTSMFMLPDEKRTGGMYNPSDPQRGSMAQSISLSGFDEDEEER